MSFFAEHWKDMIGGIGVLAIFLLIKRWSFDTPPRERVRGEVGQENDWQGTIVEEKDNAA